MIKQLFNDTKKLYIMRSKGYILFPENAIERFFTQVAPIYKIRALLLQDIENIGEEVVINQRKFLSVVSFFLYELYLYLKDSNGINKDFDEFIENKIIYTRRKYMISQYPHVFTDIGEGYKKQYWLAMVKKNYLEQKAKERKQFIKKYCLGKAEFCTTTIKKPTPEILKLMDDCTKAFDMYHNGFTIKEIMEVF